jgi:hypothetical protein
LDIENKIVAVLFQKLGCMNWGRRESLFMARVGSSLVLKLCSLEI